MMEGKRLKELRTAKGLSQQDLGKVLGVTGAAIGQWENNVRDPDSGTLSRLATYFMVSTDYLLGRSNSPTYELVRPTSGSTLSLSGDPSHFIRRAAEEGARVAAQKAAEEAARWLERNAIPVKRIPLIGSIRAGEGGVPLEERIGDIVVEESLDADFGLVVKGDSMEDAGIFEGDIVTVKKEDPPQNGDLVVALCNGGEATLKHLVQRGDQWYLRPANARMGYQDIPIKSEEDRVIGLVRDIRRRAPKAHEISRKPYSLEDEWADVTRAAEEAGLSPDELRILIDTARRIKGPRPLGNE